MKRARDRPAAGDPYHPREVAASLLLLEETGRQIDFKEETGDRPLSPAAERSSSLKRNRSLESQGDWISS